MAAAEPAFLAWAAASGIFHPLLSWPGVDAHGVRGVVATGPISAGTAVLRVPARLHLTAGAVLAQPDFGAWVRARLPPALVEVEDLVLALFLCYQRGLGPGAPWHPYVTTLPTLGGEEGGCGELACLPVVWEDGQLLGEGAPPPACHPGCPWAPLLSLGCGALADAPLAAAVRSRRRTLQADAEAVSAALHAPYTDTPSLRAVGDALVAGGAHSLPLQSSRLAVTSRMMVSGFDEPGGIMGGGGLHTPGTACMLPVACVPFGDMLNHGGEGPTVCDTDWVGDGEAGAFVVTTTTPLARGDPILISYGMTGPRECLEQFGFVEAGGAELVVPVAEVVARVVPLVGSGGGATVYTPLLARLAEEVVTPDSLLELKGDPPNSEMLALLRVLALSVQPAAEQAAALGLGPNPSQPLPARVSPSRFDVPVSRENELASIALLYAVAESAVRAVMDVHGVVFPADPPAPVAGGPPTVDRADELCATIARLLQRESGVSACLMSHAARAEGSPRARFSNAATASAYRECRLRGAYAAVDFVTTMLRVASGAPLRAPRPPPAAYSPALSSPRWALEVQQGWAEPLLDGVKTVDTRRYPLPDWAVGVPLLVLQSPPGTGLGAGGWVAHAVGVVTFRGCALYPDEAAWRDDVDRHRVPADSPQFGWGDGGVWGWDVSVAHRFPAVDCLEVAVCPSGRVLRSLFRNPLLVQ